VDLDVHDIASGDEASDFPSTYFLQIQEKTRDDSPT
jgi:hypothetical protein